MKTAFKLLIGLLLIFAVQGCRCFTDRWCDTCGLTAPNPALAGTLTAPQVTMR
jgi:hypothetical protein